MAEESLTDKATGLVDSIFGRRFGDPFVGTYSLSFLIFNFPIVIYLFSDMTADGKIESIRKSLSFVGFAEPFAATVFVLLALPIVGKKGYELLESHRVDLENHKLRQQERLLPHLNSIRTLQIALSNETERVNEANNRMSVKDQEIGMHLSTIDALKKSEREKDEWLALARAELERIKNTVRMPDDANKSSNLRNSQQRSILSKYGLNPDVLLPIFEFAQMNNVTGSEAIEEYLNAAELVTRKALDDFDLAAETFRYKLDQLPELLIERRLKDCETLIETLMSSPERPNGMRPHLKIIKHLILQVLSA